MDDQLQTFTMRYVVFDLETQNAFFDTEARDVLSLDISVASFYDSGTDEYLTIVVDELERAWPVIERAEVLVGYNSNHFDIPLLNKYYPGDLSNIKSVDLLEDIKNSLGRRIRLDSVAEATVGKKKSGNGLQALRWWREGKIDQIKKYCEQDVKVTKEVFEYALKNGKILFKDKGKVKEVPIDTSNWVPKEDSAMTHALPF
jgi:DEAD/DEAH box helicase domain-containing protein